MTSFMSCSISKTLTSRSSRTRRMRFVELQLLRGVGAGGRFVEQDHLGIGGERAGDLEAPSLAVGELARRSVLASSRETDEIEQLDRRRCRTAFSPRRVRGPFDAARRARPIPRWSSAPILMFSNTRERAEEPRGLESPRDASLGDAVRLLADHGDRRGASRREGDVPFLGLVDPGERVEQRGLARAVRTDDGEDLAAAHLEARRRSARPRRRSAASTFVTRKIRSVVAGRSRLRLPSGPRRCGSLRRPRRRRTRALRRREGNRPAGRKIIMMINSAPMYM